MKAGLMIALIVFSAGVIGYMIGAGLTYNVAHQNDAISQGVGLLFATLMSVGVAAALIVEIVVEEIHAHSD